jgi:hypothetical protein
MNANEITPRNPVVNKYGVNHVGMICAIDRAVFPALLDYWVPGCDLIGVHEMVGNALIMPEEMERVVDLRKRPLKGKEKEAREFLIEIGEIDEEDEEEEE